MVSPLFAAIMLMLRFIKIAALKVADMFQIWMVEGEKDFVEEYDEGPMARRVGAIPPGMAAIDASIAECVEDALSVGHTDETLIKLLEEAARLGPHAQASLDVGGPPMPGNLGLPPFPVGDARIGDGGAVPTCSQFPMAPPQSVAPAGGSGIDSDVAFADFMSAFRKEMQESHDRKDNLQRFVPSKSKSLAPTPISDRDEAKDGMRAFSSEAADEDDFEWPQELLTLGLGADEVALNVGSSTSSTSPTSTTTTSEDEWPDEMLM